MSKLAVRITVIGVAIYLILCYVLSLTLGIDIWSQTYYLLFELCVCLCISKQGVYHCKFIKWTAYSIFLSDCIVCFDNITDVFSVMFMVIVPVAIIIIGLSTTTILSIRHFIKVKRLKRIWKVQQDQKLRS